MKNKILVTGSAGFIGFHLCHSLLNGGFEVLGIDSLNKYYDPKLKHARLDQLKPYKNFTFEKIDIADRESLAKAFTDFSPQKVINLAAQAGVRYVKKNPDAYFDSNLKGFFNIIESCRKFNVSHLVSASTSSVYGINKSLPFYENKMADHPTQFYAATKRSNEIIAHSYSHMFNIPITLLRFFTVYGPWGRPDMSLFIFVKNIIKNKKIYVYNFGNHSRDFTYIDDIVNGIILALKKIPRPKKNSKSSKLDPSTSVAPFKILNLGGGNSIKLMKFINIIEKILLKKAKIKFIKFQDGDIKDTKANINESKKYLKYKPKIKIKQGVKKFIEWYVKYNKVKIIKSKK